MGLSESIRDQHAELLRAIEALSRAHKVEAAPVTRSLSRLSGMLFMHFEMEARSVYPILAMNNDAMVRAAGLSFLQGMQHTIAEFTGYRQKWSRPEAIEADTIRFMQETRNIFYSISKMIEREDREFYALFNKADAA